MLMPQCLDVNPKGVIHVGANIGEELELYNAKPSIQRVVWMEGNQSVIPYLRQNVERYPGHFVINEVITDVDYGEVNFHITSNGASSSVLPLAKHAELYPNIKEVRIDTVHTRTVDSVLYEAQYKPEDFDFVNLDVQGGELLVLKGMEDFIRNIKWVYTEANDAELYKGCVLLPELTDFLAKLGFKMIAEAKTGMLWSDAFFERVAQP